MAGTGQKDQALITGRIAYGYDGTNVYPLKCNTAGQLILGAGTTSIGSVILGAGTATAGTVAVSATKTIQTELLAIQSVAASTNVASTVLSLTGVKKATFFIDHGRANTVAFGTQGTEYRIEGSQKASGNDTWCPLASWVAGSAACLAVSASADVAAGGTTVVVTSGTSIPARGDVVFWLNTAATASEWMKVISVAGTASFVFLDGLTNAQAAATSIYTQAERFALLLDVEALTRARVIVNNNASGTTQAIYTRVACITEL